MRGPEARGPEARGPEARRPATVGARARSSRLLPLARGASLPATIDHRGEPGWPTITDWTLRGERVAKHLADATYDPPSWLANVCGNGCTNHDATSYVPPSPTMRRD
jgi:hypothetical protein